jgi:hypothetical protein
LPLRHAQKHGAIWLACSFKNESVDPLVGADIQATFRRYQRLEVVESTHRFASKKWLASITAKPMKPIITFSADNPHDGIGMPIGCSHDRRAFAP